MCLIAYLPSNKSLEGKEIAKAWKANRDGAGIAFFKNEKWNVVKGIMDIDTLEKLIEENKDSDKIVHFRLATSGGRHPELTHPFETPRYIIFHNGFWTDYYKWLTRIKTNTPLKQYWSNYNKIMNYNPNLVSDTKLLAFLLFLTEIEKTSIYKFEEAVNASGKVILIDKKQNIVKFYGHFYLHNGRYFSNLGYQSLVNKIKLLLL